MTVGDFLTSLHGLVEYMGYRWPSLMWVTLRRGHDRMVTIKTREACKCMDPHVPPNLPFPMAKHTYFIPRNRFESSFSTKRCSSSLGNQVDG